MTEAVEDAGTNALAPDSPPVEAVIEAPEAVVEELAEPAEVPKEGETEPKPHHLKGKTPWYMDRINEETNKRRLIEEQLAQERREKQEARALLERMQTGDKESPASRKEEPQDIEALVDARAARKLFDNDCNDVASAWGKENTAFGERLAILQGAGVMPAKDGSNTDFLMDVIAIDKANAHKILDTLASDPDRAIALYRMDSRRRVAELTRMTMNEAKPAPAPVRSGVSKVPAPKPVVDAVSDGTGDMDLSNEKLDSDTWSKLWDKKYRKKA